MTRLEELTLGLADEALAAEEAHELQSLLATAGPARDEHIRILEIEAGLRTTRQNLDLVQPIMAHLRAQMASSVTEGVMAKIKQHPLPGRRREDLDGTGFLDQIRASLSRVLQRTGSLGGSLRPAWVVAAACLLLLVGFGSWFFGPTMGAPVVAEVKGADLSLERAGHPVSVRPGVALQFGDVLRTPAGVSADITFSSEKTRLSILPGTELKVVSSWRGKRFNLEAGKIEAVVARQRPFRPMRILTPQAEARVLGTKFSLLTSAESTRLEVAEGTVRLTRLSDALSTKVPAGNYALVSTNTVLAPLPLTGGIYREYWTNLPGDAFVALLAYTNYPERPDGREFMTNLVSLELPSNWADNYGQRLRGYFHPPKTGDYSFWLAARNDASFWLSPDDKPEHKVPMARSWDATRQGFESSEQLSSQQHSPAVELVAGKRYYFEVLHKAGVGDDHLAVAWQGPGVEREIIPIQFCSPFKPKERKR
jgi:hypothetical protein